MASYQLVPSNETARALPHMGSGLLIAKSLKLGRSVSVEGNAGYRFPAAWSQISSNHCRVFCEVREVSFGSNNHT